MRRLIWSARSIRDLADIQAHIAADNPPAARDVAARIFRDADRLPDLPFIGRIGRREGTREWVVRRTPYIIIYIVTLNAVRIMTVRHGARRWPPTP